MHTGLWHPWLPGTWVFGIKVGNVCSAGGTIKKPVHDMPEKKKDPLGPLPRDVFSKGSVKVDVPAPMRCN